MSFLLDTNICSAYLKRPGRLAHRFIQRGGGLYLPTIALGELYVWAELRVAAVDTFSLIEDDLLKVVQLLDFDDHCAREYGRLRTDSLRRGTNLSPPDLMIAATAIVHDLAVVTHNVKHFLLIPGLHVVDWRTA